VSTQVDGPTGSGATDAQTPDAPTTERRPRHLGRRVALVAVLVVVLVALAAAWVAFRAVQAAGALMDARDVVSTVDGVVGGGALDDADVAALTAAVPQAQDATERARRASSDPVWRVAEHAPWVGRQLHAVRTVSTSLDDVTHDAMPAVVEIGDLLGSGDLGRDDGSIDVQALAAAAPKLTAAAAVAARADREVAGIDTATLAGPLVDPVRTASDGLDRISGTLTGVSRAAALVPPMLGADGKRTYLVLALNSAELRSAGGIVGSILQVTADDGHLKLGKQVTTAQLGRLDEPVVPLTDAETALHGTALGRWIQNAASTPDFPRTAELITARWAKDVGGEVDGVIATDPVAVKDVLEATGPVTTSGGATLRADNLLTYLLRDAYRTSATGTEADALFSSAAGAVFGALTDGAGSSQALLDAVSGATSQGRFRVWSAHADEQDVIAGAQLGGAFLSGDHPDAVGVFFNDATEGKLDYYLDTDVTVENLECTGAAPTATVRVTLAYDPPKKVTDLPEYVVGARGDAITPGSVATGVLVYAPVGAALDALRQDGTLVAGAQADEDGRRAVVATSVLAPGGTTTYEATVPVRHGAVEVWTTPTIHGGGFVRAECPAG